MTSTLDPQIELESINKKRLKRFVTLAVVVFLAAVALTVGALLLTDKVASAKDPGIGACEQMAANAKAEQKHNSYAKMTDAQRVEKRTPFANSKYADIKVAGTNLVDTLYELDQKENADLGDALVIMATVRTQYAALQTACGAHGVELANLPST